MLRENNICRIDIISAILLNVFQMNRFVLLLLFAISSVFFYSCDGIFHYLYDDPKQLPQSEYGFIKVDETTCSGVIYVDASSFERWLYVDFKNKKVDTTNILMGEDEPAQWDFALHRFDAKTNNGTVAATDFTSLDDLRAAGIIDIDGFTADVDDSVMVDVTDMMSGIVKYAPSKKNRVLSSWMSVDISVMPPIYTLSNKVYILQMPDGTRAALLLVNYMNTSGVRGFLTIHYIYPY